MTDTQYLRFSLKENATIFTKKLDSSNNGQVLKFVANPMASMIKKVQTDNATVTRWYTNTLGLTISRWREIKYIGTQIAFKPLATNGSVDPAHIQQTATTNPIATTVQGAINPYDSNNHIHWRRWMGGNLNIPTIAVEGDATNSMRLDNYWLQDDRFNHANVNQGFETFIAPLRSKITAGSTVSQGLFGYYSASSLTANSASSGTYGDPRMMTALTGSLDDVEEQGWLPNPMAGLKYTMDEREPGLEGDFENVEIEGFNTKFPWYGDVLDASTLSSSVSKDLICELTLERFMAPMLIVRIPPAYSTVYGWRVYISHNFAVRKPFMTASAWEVSHITEQQAIPIIRATVEGASEEDKREFRMEEKPVKIIQALQVDPYADTEYPNTISMASNMKYFGGMWGHMEPRDANTYETKPETKPQISPIIDAEALQAEDEEGMIPHN